MSDPTPRDTRLFDAGAHWATEPTDRRGYGDALRDAVERATTPGDRDRGRELAAALARVQGALVHELEQITSSWARSAFGRVLDVLDQEARRPLAAPAETRPTTGPSGELWDGPAGDPVGTIREGLDGLLAVKTSVSASDPWHWSLDDEQVTDEAVVSMTRQWHPDVRSHEVLAAPAETEAGDEWAPDERDPLERFGVRDSWDHPGWPIAKRIVATVRDGDPAEIDSTDGDYEAVLGLLDAAAWRRDIAAADAMGLVGDWGKDDVTEAVTEAMHRYRLAATPPAPEGEARSARQGRYRKCGEAYELVITSHDVGNPDRYGDEDECEGSDSEEWDPVAPPATGDVPTREDVAALVANLEDVHGNAEDEDDAATLLAAMVALRKLDRARTAVPAGPQAEGAGETEVRRVLADRGFRGDDEPVHVLLGRVLDWLGARSTDPYGTGGSYRDPSAEDGGDTADGER